MGFGEIKLLTGRSNSKLASDVANHLGLELVSAKLSRFSDGEIQVEIHENVRGRDVYIIQSTCTPVNDHLMELLILGDACKRASAARMTAVLPYYGYARQDRKVFSRAPITAKLVADLISVTGFHRVLTMDLHAGQIQGFFDIPVDNIFAIRNLIPRFAEMWGGEELVVVSPDAGGAERARSVAKKLNAGLAIIDKRRLKPNEAAIMHIVGDVRGKTALIVDDLIDTAGTLTKAAQAVMEVGGAREVCALATHAVLSGPAVQRISESVLTKVLVSDTIPLSEEAVACGKFEVVSVADLLGKAVRSIHDSDSISRLFL